MLRVILLCLSLSLVIEAENPTWSKNAVPLGDCLGNASHPIPSPDGNTILELQCRAIKGESAGTPYLNVRMSGGAWRDLILDEGAHEVLWSPDSKAFLINGSTNAYAGFFVSVYLVSNTGVKKLRVTDAAQTDMVKAFPPCGALNRDERMCAEIKHPEFNMSALAWVKGSSAIVVMAEVPCISTYGGIMCQVKGYELTIPAGLILMRLTAQDLKARWQQIMAWEMHIPETPRFGPAQKQR